MPFLAVYPILLHVCCLDNNIKNSVYAKQTRAYIFFVPKKKRNINILPFPINCSYFSIKHVFIKKKKQKQKQKKY